MLITNGTLLTFGEHPRVIPGGAVYIENDTIAAIGSSAELTASYPQAEVLDAGGKIVMPGLICGHTHFYGAFARGMAVPGEPPANFLQILERLWWKLDELDTGRLLSECYGLSGRCYPAWDHHPHRPPRQPERHRWLPGCAG